MSHKTREDNYKRRSLHTSTKFSMVLKLIPRIASFTRDMQIEHHLQVSYGYLLDLLELCLKI